MKKEKILEQLRSMSKRPEMYGEPHALETNARFLSHLLRSDHENWDLTHTDIVWQIVVREVGNEKCLCEEDRDKILQYEAESYENNDTALERLIEGFHEIWGGAKNPDPISWHEESGGLSVRWNGDPVYVPSVFERCIGGECMSACELDILLRSYTLNAGLVAQKRGLTERYREVIRERGHRHPSARLYHRADQKELDYVPFDLARFTSWPKLKEGISKVIDIFEEDRVVSYS